MLLGEQLGFAPRIGNAVAIDQERAAVDQGVEEEGRDTDRLEELRRHDEPDPEAPQGGRLEERCRAAAQLLIARRDHRDVAQDRGDACSGRCTLQDAREGQHGEQEDAAKGGDPSREPGEDHRDGPEDRPQLHDPVVADVI